jgi:sugar (pentulose or hexulose) kinase
VVAGLSLASSPVEVLAGLLESVCFGLAEGDDALRAGLGQTPEVVATGGALLASGWWQRTLAAVLGRPLALLEARELSAEGAAVSALGIDAQPARVGTVEADEERVTAARAARERQAGLAGRLGWTTAGR